MKKPRVVVLRTAGTNCDCETQYAFERADAEAERIHVNRIVEKPSLLDGFQCMVIPGGFSYGDDLGAGRILANELVHSLRESLARFLEDGKLILGVCNGFQVLVKARLLPNIPDAGSDGKQWRSAEPQATLAFNDSNRFEDRWVYLKAASDKCVFVKRGEDMYLPIAHAEGRFVCRDEAAFKHLVENDQVVFRYVGPDGKPAGYPWNPNGSTDAIAGVCDPTGRVFGLMPHPERHVEPTQHPRWTRDGLAPEGEGLRVFKNAVAYLRGNF
ncbi:MAG TPA: phosphoribosylformylglycinamidine synthase I [Candidatus Brocadiia bacterium]|nr:phosphoribosylformylglycinamidine synthase I [Candidatus Brocadiia bacterium]